jgi:hypothetical protein
MTAVKNHLIDSSFFVGMRTIACGRVLPPHHHLIFPGHDYHSCFSSASTFEIVLLLFAPASHPSRVAQARTGEIEWLAFWYRRPQRNA